jgi:hypothetical protein
MTVHEQLETSIKEYIQAVVELRMLDHQSEEHGAAPIRGAARRATDRVEAAEDTLSLAIRLIPVPTDDVPKAGD